MRIIAVSISGKHQVKLSCSICNKVVTAPFKVLDIMEAIRWVDWYVNSANQLQCKSCIK